MKYCKKCKRIFSYGDASIKCPVCNILLKKNIGPDDDVFFAYMTGEDKDKLLKMFDENGISYYEANPIVDPTDDLIESGFEGGMDIYVKFKDFEKCEHLHSMLGTNPNDNCTDYLCENNVEYDEITPVKSKMSAFLLAVAFLAVITFVVICTDMAIEWIRDILYNTPEI